MALERIQTSKDNVAPRVVDSLDHRIPVMTGDADSFHNTVLLGLCQTVHIKLTGFRPVAFRHAVQQKDIKIVCTSFLAETVKCFADRLTFFRPFFVRPHLRHQGEFLAGQLFQGFSDKWLRTVHIGHVEETNTAFITVTGHLHKVIQSEPGLVGLVIPAFRPGSHSYTGDFQSGLSQFHPVNRYIRRNGHPYIGKSRVS